MFTRDLWFTAEWSVDRLDSLSNTDDAERETPKGEAIYVTIAMFWIDDDTVKVSNCPFSNGSKKWSGGLEFKNCN